MLGISIPQSCCERTLFDKNLPQGLFSCVELQGDVILDKNLVKLISEKRAGLINSYDYIKNSTIINSLDQSEIFQDSVISTIETLFDEPVYDNLENITIDFGLMRDNDQEKTLKFIQKLYFKIYRSGKNICLPVTVPGMDAKKEMMSKLFYKLMLNNFKICLNIYPHEIDKNDYYSEFINNFTFRISLIRICYDAASGNYLSDKLLEHIIEILEKCGCCCPIIFVPNVQSAETLVSEADNIFNIIKTTDKLQKYFNLIAHN